MAYSNISPLYYNKANHVKRRVECLISVVYHVHQTEIKVNLHFTETKNVLDQSVSRLILLSNYADRLFIYTLMSS